MARTYAIPDLHGRFDLLVKTVAAITQLGGGTVVFLGDYVDHGPESRQAVECLLQGAPAGQHWITLCGNHEVMMHRYCTGATSRPLWLETGGAATLTSYGGLVPKAHLEWLRALPRLHVTPHRIFVHAGVDPDLPLEQQGDEILLWQRYSKWADTGHGTRHVVHGHTPHLSGPELRTRRTNLDTRSWQTGRLAVGVFDDDRPGGPLDVMWIENRPFY